MPKCADTDKQKISQYRWLPISEPIIGATLIHIKTHDSESRGQEEAQQRDHRVSHLHAAPPQNSQTLQPSRH